MVSLLEGCSWKWLNNVLHLELDVREVRLGQWKLRGCRSLGMAENMVLNMISDRYEGNFT